MYFSMGLPKVFSWLLAAAIAVQPMSGFSCGCGGASADAGAQPAKQGRCCCGSAQRSCCCYYSVRKDKTVSKPQRTCCQQSPKRENAPLGASVCRCGSGTPIAPQSTPAQRSLTDDLATSAVCACAATVDVPAIHQNGWDCNLSTDFASASERCIALCRLLI
jgi:hypothetical protein